MLRSLQILLLLIFSAFVLQGQPQVDSIAVDTATVDSLLSPMDSAAVERESTKRVEEETYMDGAPVSEDLRQEVDPWLLWLFFAQLIFLGVSRYLYPPIFAELGRHIFNHNIAMQRYRHRDFEPTTIDWLLRLNALVTITLLICFALEQWWSVEFTPLLLLIVAAFLVMFYLFRKIVKTVLGNLFHLREILGFTSFYSDYLIKGLGILGFPLLLIYSFGNPLTEVIVFYLVIILFGVFITARILGGFRAGSSLILGSISHFILYICTLEILPFLLACKVFIDMQGWA